MGIRIATSLILIWVVASWRQSACGQEAEVPLRSVDAIHALPESQLGGRVRVDLECVIAVNQPEWPISFVHDGRTGMFVVGITDQALRPGMQVRIQGYVTPQRNIFSEQITLSDNGVVLPDPKLVTFDWLQSGNDDSQYVEIEGQLIGVTSEQYQHVLDLVSSEGMGFRALISEGAVALSEIRKQLGQHLRLSGTVGARVDGEGKFRTFQIWLTDKNSIQLSGSEPQVIGISTIQTLMNVTRVSQAAGYYRIGANVDYHLGNQSLLVHDATGCLIVDLSQFRLPKVGTFQEIRGILDTTTQPPVLRYAEAELVAGDPVPLPEPVRMTIPDLVAMKLSGQIVATTGEYLGAFEVGGRRGFLLQSNHILLPVILPEGSIDEPVRGTRVDVQGAWVQQQSLIGFNIGSCAIYCHADDVRIGSQLSWILVTLGGTLAAVSGIGFLWVVALKRQVRVQTGRALQEYENRRQAEDHKKELEEQLFHAQKMESLGVLAGGIAHDFNNLLTIILGNASLIQNAGTLQKDDVACLGNIIAAASRAGELTRQMLAYAGRRLPEVQSVQLSDLVLDFSVLLQASVAKTTQLVLDLSPSLPRVKADATQIRQVILNLVMNGSESMDGRPGTIQIRAAVVELHEEEIRDMTVRLDAVPGKYVVLKVTDDGEGMDARVRARMFDPFFTTKFSGRGLGLSTVLGIVRGHGGCIRVTGQPGRGTVIEVFLPVDSSEVSEVVSCDVTDEPGIRAGRILIVDDEPAVLGILGRTLRHAGFDCVETTSGDEALAMLEQNRTFVDCVVTDQTMPGISGVELAARIRTIHPELSVILCSGYTEPQTDPRYSEDLIAAYLRKPFDLQNLTSTVASVLARGTRQAVVSH